MSEEVDLSQFHQAFFEEAHEHLASMEELLLGIDDLDDPDAEELNAIFRAAHSIKGSAGTFGFLKVQDVTHVLESILDRIRNGNTDLTNERTDLFLEAGDILKDLIECHEAEEDIDEESADSIIERLQADLDAEEEGGTAKQPEDPVEVEDDTSASGGFGLFEDDDSISEEDTSAPGGFGLFDDDDSISEEDTSAPGGFGLFDDTPINASVEENVVEPKSNPAPATKTSVPESKKSKTTPKPKAKSKAKPKGQKKEAEKTIRVGVEKIDQLINAIGEMVITQSVIALTSGMDTDQSGSVKDKEIDIKNLHESIHVLQRNVKDLQETIMSIRMVSINTVFQRFPRLVRDMATKLGKDIDLIIEGESTELDKGLIEKLTDPLTHILRNSIDHGIETRDERAETNKEKQAKIKISASQVGGNVLIEIVDDGRGLNKAKILEKAESSGLNVPAGMPDSEIWLLIFAPGFSTADKVSELSGRGVGMDVVKKNIASMGGRVEIESSPGEGTKLTIYLPLTMAILNGMIVKTQDINYIIPMLSIIETIKPDTDMIKKVGGSDSKVMEIRGEHVPIVDIQAIFKVGSEDEYQAYLEKTKNIDFYKDKIMMLIEADDKKALIVLDELNGQQQVVIKDIEDNYKKIKGISGATILGDGNVALILDIQYFVGMSNNDLLELKVLRDNNMRMSQSNKMEISGE